MYIIETDGIEVTAFPQFVPERSIPHSDYYFYIYHIQIKNNSTATMQLLSRHWIITDGKGRTEEVKGDGVVGEQPVLKPGETYSYTSSCPLATPTGNMRGTYFMQGVEGRKYGVKIPLFFLRNDQVMQ